MRGIPILRCLEINWNESTSCQEVIAVDMIGSAIISEVGNLLKRSLSLSQIAWVNPVCHLRGLGISLRESTYSHLQIFMEYLLCARHHSVVLNKLGSSQMNLVQV